MKEILFSTPEDQIIALEKKNLLIQNKEEAIKILRTYGYYNVINSYKGPYINEKKEYILSSSFEQIFSLFTLDHHLRNSVMAAMLDLEEHLKAVTSEVLFESFGANQEDYLNWNNFSDRRTSKPQFSLKGILATLRNNLNSDKNPIRYYRTTHGIIPPWILFKGTYFSTLINFIRLFKSPEKKLLISKLFEIPIEDITPEITTLFMDTLFVCLEYRNAAAHGGRIYNYIAAHSVNVNGIPNLSVCSPLLDQFPNCYGVAQLLVLLSCFSYQQPMYIILNSINEQINRHLKIYPQDKDVLGDTIGIIIEQAN